ncbi:MAG: M23 family metallopeptidase [Treponema sp.]|nr:M23 family metallopeptidase [Treponema sp.]
MEIINYYTSERQPSWPRLRTRERSHVKAQAVVLKRRTVSVKDMFFTVRAALFSFAVTVRSLIRYAWMIPAVCAAVAIPVLISNLIDYSQSFAKVVDFEADSAVSYEYLNAAMSSFALDSVYYDRDGNILSSDGTLAVSSVTIKEPVTYQTYTVRAGDTISGISKKFGLSNISTLIAVNNISNVRSLRSGQKLRIPSYDGLVHVVTAGETLGSVAKKFNATVEDILDVNNLATETLQAGMSLFIPGARLDSETLQRAMGELFVYPIKASWRLSSRFGYRIDPIKNTPSSHTGIDLACPEGTKIYSAMSGTVAYTGFSSVYGNYVIVKHHDGYQTLYAHMSKIIAKKGEKVTQDTVIGLVGSTGYSTGNHLHFSVYKNGKLVDPLTVLK